VVAATWREPEAVLFLMFTVVLTSAGAVALHSPRLRVRTLGIAAIASPLLLLGVTSGLIWGLLVAALLAVLMWLIGIASLAAIGVTDRGSSTHALAFGVGSGVIAYSVFGLGLVGLLSGPFIGGTFAALAIASGLMLRRYDASSLIGWRPLQAIETFMVAVAVLTAFGVLPYAFAPEIKYDAVYYQLAMVREFLQQGSVAQLPNLFASNFPLVPQLVYASSVALSGALDSAKLVHLFIGCAVALAIFATGSQLHSRYAGVLGAILWLSVPLVLWEMSTAYVDLFSVLYVLLSVLATILWIERQHPSYALVAGVFCGLGLGIKITAALPALSLGGAVLILFIRNRRGLTTWIGAAGIAAVVGAPWYLRSYLLTGNPVFPFLNSLFRSPQWELVDDTFNFANFGLGSAPSDLLLSPFRLVTQSSRFGEMPDGALGLLPMIGAVALVGGLIARDRRLAFLALSAAGASVLWFVSAQYGRYLLPILAIEAVLAATLLANLTRRVPRAAISTVSSVILVLSFAGYLGTVAPVPGYVPWPVVLGEQDRGDYLNIALRHYAAYRWLSDHAPPSTQVLGVGYSDWPIVYSDRRIFIGHMTQIGRQIRDARSPDEARRLLDQGNFSYVIVDYFPRAAPWQSYFVIPSDDFVQRSLRIAYANNYVYVYQIAPPVEQGAEVLRDPDLRELGNSGSSWQEFGSARSAEGICRGARIGNQGGYIQSFDARPDTVYLFRSTLRALSGEGDGKLQVNWIRNDGSTQGNVEIYPISGNSAVYAMASTSPADAKQGVVYLSGYGDTDVCVERSSVSPVP